MPSRDFTAILPKDAVQLAPRTFHNTARDCIEREAQCDADMVEHEYIYQLL